MTDPNPDQAPTSDYDETRLVLDAQARAWTATARRWIWLVALASLATAAVGIGALIF